MKTIAKITSWGKGENKSKVTLFSNADYSFKMPSEKEYTYNLFFEKDVNKELEIRPVSKSEEFDVDEKFESLILYLFKNSMIAEFTAEFNENGKYKITSITIESK
ncbi:hypothetical protein [Desulfuribacillus alkaliarsenatis]|uniref:Uncharacterized protein n=1 Tax=Desulfuribacillus alkaliarsenatis TaxID=766136 RepID=A0A1E5G2B8_9FIRM|nr:hypothetical protein [Desulfuribacillus alkaliarsenatis]OEF97138.1 hypothetical protein BHF68_05955 [Desulfuribacillus alkaliarsenatis]